MLKFTFLNDEKNIRLPYSISLAVYGHVKILNTFVHENYLLIIRCVGRPYKTSRLRPQNIKLLISQCDIKKYCIHAFYRI